MSTPTERGARVRVPPPLVFAACTLSAVALHNLVMPLRLPAPRLLTVALGIGIALLGVATTASARILFLRTGQCPTPWSPTPSLIARGPYRFTRNPMYVGITTLLVGIGVAFNVLWISLFALAALTIVHFIAVVREEAYLAAKFGASYASYAARVRRYL
jgi:protein-S-isoprenylcysteine O-methyltransferase Ste14